MRLLMSAYVQIFLSKLPELEFSPRGSINTTRLREITATAVQPCRGQARDNDAQMPAQMNCDITILKNYELARLELFEIICFHWAKTRNVCKHSQNTPPPLS